MLSLSALTYDGAQRKGVDHRTDQTQTMHLMDAQASVEAAFCMFKVDLSDLTSVQYYLWCRLDSLSVPTVCAECKEGALKWLEGYCSDLEADASAFRDKAEGLLKRAVDSHRNAEGDHRAVERAARDAERFERSAERADSESDDLQEEARLCCEFVEQLRTENRLDP